MKNCFFYWMLLLAFPVLSGCTVDMELWIDNGGGGNGNVSVIGAPMLSPDELRSNLEKKGLTVVSIDRKNMGNMVAKVRWTDFNRGIGKRQFIDNVYILLDFGNVEMGTITAHVDGKLVPEKTTGKPKDATTVVFQQGRARLVYLPNKASGFPLYALAAVGLVVIIGIIVAMKMRDGQQQATASSSEPARSDAVSPNDDQRFCSGCGTERLPDHQYCTKCGKKIIG